MEMTIGRLMIGTSLLHNGAAAHGESVHKAQTSDHFGPLPNGDGGGGGAGVDVVLVSLGEAGDRPRLSRLFLIAPCSKCRRQTVQVQSVLGKVRSVLCAMQ